ncbi:MAG: hypothetical protein ACHQAQ_15600 [Hyphomicrobiales bacterium]
MSARAPRMTPEAFCAAFVSGLVSLGVNSILPRSNAARRGFRATLRALDRAIAKQTNKEKLYELLKIRTSLAPSLSGGYDSFETYLRGLQTSIVSSPNPTLAFLKFDISPTFAKTSLAKLDEDWLAIVNSAASEFKSLGGASSQGDERLSQLSSA